MRRLGSALASIALVAMLAIAVPSPAHAVDPLPPAVDEIPDITSRALKSLTGSGLGDSTLIEMWRTMTGAWKGGTLIGPNGPGGVLVTREVTGTALATIPKPITAPAAVTRVGGAAVVAPMLAWGISSNGTLAVLGAATGTSYEKMYCSQPGWYQGITSFINMGFAPDCVAMVTTPNPDITNLASATYNGVTYTLVKWGSTVNENFYFICAGSGALWVQSNGYPNPQYGFPTGAPPGCSSWAGSKRRITLKPETVTAFTVRPSQGSSTVLATSTPTDADPVRTPTCRIDWEDGTTTNGTGTAYRETEGLPMSATGLGCWEAYVSKPGRGPALLPSRIRVDSEDDAGAITTISDQDVPEFGPDDRKAFEPTATRGLVLEKTVNGITDSCNTWAANCAGWWAATSNGTQTETSTGTYRCSFGGQTIPLVECGPYRGTFDTRTSTPTITDPATGAETPWTSGSPLNTTSPAVGLDPGGECFAQGWSSVANPLEWVLLPVKCALVWAFVPRQTVVEDTVGGLQDAVTDSSIGSLAASFITLPEMFNGGSGCGGLPFHLEGPGWAFNTQLFAACEEPMAGIAATVRGILTFVILLSGALACVRYAAGLAGYLHLGVSEAPSTSGVRFE